MHNKAKRIVAILLSVVMATSVFSDLGLTVGATGTAKAVELVANGALGGVLGAQQSNVWFGNYKQSNDGNGGYTVEPVKWRVLSNADGKLFLLADQNLDAVQYNGNHENVTWDTCEIRDWLNGYGSMQDVGFLGTAFTAKEQAAIAASTVVSEENPQYSVYGGEDTMDKVFLLSAGEAVTAAYGFTDNYDNTDSRVAINTDYVENRVTLHFNDGAGRWWLRSTGESNDKAAFVSQFGQVNLKGAEVPTSSVAVRPAANVDLGQVLFVSPAVGGKPAPDAEIDDIFVKNAYGKNIMSPVSDYNGFDWKLTVLDSSRSNFTARCLAFKTGTKNATCKIRYSNATGGEYDRISAMIVDADGHVKYSGVLGYANPATTTFETDVTGQYIPGDRIYIYNEEVHGDKQTDYSSRLIDITPEKLPEGLTATVGQRLADVAIPNPEGNTSGTWTWDDPTIEINTAGEYSFPATFTPSNTDAFETIQTNLTVTVSAPAAGDEITATIDDQIRVNIKLDMDTAHKDAETVAITFRGETMTYDVRGESGQYCASFNIAPAYAAEEFTVSVDGEPIEQDIHSVKDYCEALMEAYPADGEVYALADALLRYAQAANDYFELGDEIADISDLDSDFTWSYAFNNATNLNIYSLSFMALTQPEYRFYVKDLTEEQAAAYNAAGVSAAYADTSVTETPNARFVKTSDGKVLLEVTGITVQTMDKPIVVTIEGVGTLTFAGNDFAKLMVASGGDTMAPLGVALYDYGVAAAEYEG